MLPLLQHYKTDWPTHKWLFIQHQSLPLSEQAQHGLAAWYFLQCRLFNFWIFTNLHFVLVWIRFFFKIFLVDRETAGPPPLINIITFCFLQIRNCQINFLQLCSIIRWLEIFFKNIKWFWDRKPFLISRSILHQICQPKWLVFSFYHRNKNGGWIQKTDFVLTIIHGQTITLNIDKANFVKNKTTTFRFKNSNSLWKFVCFTTTDDQLKIPEKVYCDV